MPKRKFDKKKHSAQAYELKKSGKAGKGGWGDPSEGMDADYVRKDPRELKNATVKTGANPPELIRKEDKNVEDWTTEEVSEWVLSFGNAYQDTASTFLQLGIEGRTLISIQYDDLEETLGKGLKTRKLWGELEKLREVQNEESNVDPSVPTWRFFSSSGWLEFPARESEEIEKAYQKGDDVNIRGWTLRLTSQTPHATYEDFTRMLSREGGFGKAFDGPPAEQLSNLSVNPNERTWARIASQAPSGEIRSDLGALSPRSQSSSMKTFSARRSFLSMEPCDIYRTGACLDSDVIGKIKRFELVNFEDIGIGGIAMITEPVKGFVPMAGEDVTKARFARVFIIRGIVYESEKKKSFKSMGEGLRAVEAMYAKFRVQVFDAAGMIIGNYGTPALPEATPVILEEIEGAVSMHFVKAISVDTWNEVPELVVQRSTVNIAWNLWKKDALNSGLASTDVANVQQLFRTKKNKAKILVGKALEWHGMDCIQNIKIVGSKDKDTNLTMAEVTIDRSAYVKRAQQLKRRSEEFVKTNVLNYIDRPAETREVGLLGPVGANIGRKSPTPLTSEKLRDVVANFKDLNSRPDASYRIHRQFLRYAQTLTSVLGEILDDLFDPDVVDCILMFFDDGNGDFMTNAKGSLAYKSTGSKCLDFYSGYESTKTVIYLKDDNPVMTGEKISSGFLDQCWKEHPLTCLRLIFHLGAAREGKQDLHGFYVCMHWLYEKHPYTLLANLHLLPDVNYFKGMLEVLDRIMEDDEGARAERNDWYKRTNKSYKKATQDCEDGMEIFEKSFLKGKQCYKKNEMQFARDLLQKYDSDIVFRALHRKVAQTFAKSLLADANKKHNLSLACKWCPTEGAKHDKHLLMHEAIARECFPPKENETEFEYQRSIRNRLRKELVSPLRLRTKVTERLISTKKLEMINYEHVSGASMRKNQSTFERLDPKGFGKYLQDVADGKKKVKSGAISPVELYMKVRDLCRRHVTDPKEFALLNGQWATMIEKLKKKIPEDQRNIVAAIDTSGSMSCNTSVPNQQCIDVAKAMGLVCLDLAEGTYKGHTLLYTTHCVTVSVKGETLKEKYEDLERQIFSGGTSYGCVLDEVKKNAMTGAFGFPNRVIILSDMEFHRGHSCSLSVAMNTFQHARQTVATQKMISLEEVVNPEIVFWNIAATSKPARKTDIGCSMISGHSPVVFVDVLANAWSDMKRDVVTGQTQNDPLTVMLNALSKPLYRQLRAVTSQEEAYDLLVEILKQDEVTDEMEVDGDDEEDLMDKDETHI